MKRQFFSIITMGLLVVGLFQMIATGLPLKALRNMVNPALTLAQPAQTAPRQANAAQITGEYSGQVKLQGSLSGVYSDTLAIPTPQAAGTSAAPDLGSIDLEIQLNQSDNVINGYIVLAHTLVFTREHTITVGGTPLDIGPMVQGSFDGANLTLVSERMSLVIAGRSVERQFRLTGTVDAANGRKFTGEYRETIWGYTPQPITAMGTFTLQWVGASSVASTPPDGSNSDFTNRLYLPLVRR